MTITQLCEKVNVDCAKLNSIVTARGGIYFFILGDNQLFLFILAEALVLMLGYYLRKVPMTGR